MLDGKMIPKSLIDQLAPNNPVFHRTVFTGALANERAEEVIAKLFPYPDMAYDAETGKNGGAVRGAMDWVFHEAVMHDYYPELKEIHRIELSYWASQGVGAFSSRAYTPSNLKVYKDLSESGEMPVRNGYAWGWRETFFDSDPYLLECTYDPSKNHFENIVEFVKAGGRVAGLHMGGDLDMDYLLEAIERGSKEAGLTPQQIAAKRHSYDHLTMGPRPDQIQRLKRLGIALGGAPFFYMQNAPQQFKRYGEAVAEWNNPKKSLIEAQVWF
jgi:predicted amidohydrolase YtcJ